MTDDPRVQQLLDELLASDTTPEAVCKSCPELLPVVRKRWRRVRRLRTDLDAIFPPLDGAAPPQETDLPLVPGYELEAVLGRGGMGIVFRARHRRLDRLVALKMLLVGACATPHERARFQREAEAVARLKHPNIVQVYDVGDTDGRPYFTMELVDGGSLAQQLSGTPQPARQVAVIVATLAKAIHAAHQAAIVHRDLKPANILLTAESTPKVADFGLARHFEGQSSLTLTGVRIGTPSYMAPEQVIGKVGTIGPGADMYGLGAILYEMLTGRPPFRGETAAETERQVIHDEPVPPSRLNTSVPRDLETICLKCLSKEPERRYASAAALADDLGRFGEGRPIQARPVGWAERSWRWGRRNPTAAALLATALALVGLTSGGGVWVVQQRARHDEELRNDVGTAVAQAAALRKSFHFAQGRKLLEQARRRLGPEGPEDLCRQVDQGRADLDLVERLDAARAQAATLVGGRFDPAGAEPPYASAFADAGLGREGDDVEAVAARVRESAVREDLVAALDDWASITPDRDRRKWLLAVARSCDQDTVRNGLRQPELWQDRARLTQLAGERNVAELSPQLATALGRVARECRADAVPLLTAAQARFPQDFWINFELGFALHRAHRFDEALSYYRSALALRPDVGVALNGVGSVLSNLGREDEAMGYLLQAVQLDPKNAWALNNLGNALRKKGQLHDALGLLQRALSIDPTAGPVHNNLGLTLHALGRVDEANEQYREAIRYDPAAAQPHWNLGVSLYEKDRDKAIECYRQAIRLDPTSADACDALGRALRDKGEHEEAIDLIQQAVRIEPHFMPRQIFLAFCLYTGACAAVRAADRQGSAAAPPGEPDAAAQRRKALDWLRADLDLAGRLQRAGQLVSRPPGDWPKDPALATVRDSAALAKLPEAERKQWQRLWAEVAAIRAADPLERGRELAAQREWAEAAEGYARALALGPTDDGHFWFEYAALSLLSDDQPGYTKACAHMVARAGQRGGPRPYHMARACTLASDAVSDAGVPGRLAERELNASARQFWSLTEQGALAYRASQFQQAVPLFEQSLKADSAPGRAVVNWLWLALANERVGNAAEARRWLSKAQAWLDQYRDGLPERADQEFGLHYHNWLEAHVLRREAEALIQPAEDR